MKAKRRSSSDPPVSRPRLLAAAIVVGGVVWWLNWVRAGAAATDDTTQVASIAPGPETPPSLRGMDELVSLDLRSTEATDALKYLATKGGLNISISKNVGGRVNLLLTDVPIRDAFDLILRSNELAFDKQGNIYNIMSDQEYRALYGRRFSDLREVRTFRCVEHLAG